MTSDRKSECDLSGIDEPAACFDQPELLWGRRLGRPLLDAASPFEERVERAWAYIKATRFTPDEHERLREVLIITIQPEVPKRETK